MYFNDNTEKLIHILITTFEYYSLINIPEVRIVHCNFNQDLFH